MSQHNVLTFMLKEVENISNDTPVKEESCRPTEPTTGDPSQQSSSLLHNVDNTIRQMQLSGRCQELLGRIGINVNGTFDKNRVFVYVLEWGPSPVARSHLGLIR